MPLEKRVFFPYVISKKGSKFQGKNMQNTVSKIPNALFPSSPSIIMFGFCDIQNNQGLGKGYQPQPSASAHNPYLHLDYSGYHKNVIQ